MYFNKMSKLLSPLLITNTSSKRHFFEWINKMFNAVDEPRLNALGPDRVCAEWILRNGGKVKFVGADQFTFNYNSLPEEDVPVQIEEIDASGSAIMHYGFGHLKGCQYITKMILHDCAYLRNEALSLIEPINNSLVYLQVSNCLNIDGNGLLGLRNLTNLKQLILFQLAVNNKEDIVKELQKTLINCNIDFK